MFMASLSSNSVMQRSAPDPLQCPRCNSFNTKFCYYNNYSLSQPRHFCKACKRYWTRGGTLRNVPIGGGYRKTKKFKRHPPPPADALPSFPNPIFYSMPTNLPIELNFPFLETRVSSENSRYGGFSPCFQNVVEQNIEDRADFISFGSSDISTQRPWFSSSTTYEEMQVSVGNGHIGKELNQIEQMSSSPYLWNSNNVGVSFDPSSSVPSLI